MDKDIFKILKNSITTTQYITKIRSEKFLKKNSYNESMSIEEYLNIAEENGEKDIILQLQEYEYEKNYRYITLYNYNNEKLLDIIKNLSNEVVNNNEFDNLSKAPKKPSIKYYGEKEVDIKFSIKLKSKYREIYIKYVVICTIFIEEKLVAIKHYSVSEEYYRDEYYIETNNIIKYWIENNLKVELTEFDSMKVFKELYKNLKSNKENYRNVSIHSISMDDELNGRTYFRASDNEMLPFIGSIARIAETFECESDKKKILEYIGKYEDEAIIRNIAIKWKNKFENNRVNQLGSITVGIVKAYSVNNVDNELKFEFILHHIKQDESVNRERINYAIKYISSYINTVEG